MAFVETIVMHTFPGDFYLMQNYIHLVLLYANICRCSAFVSCFLYTLASVSQSNLLSSSAIVLMFFFLSFFFSYYLINFNFLFIQCISLSLTFSPCLPFIRKFHSVYFIFIFALTMPSFVLSHRHSISFPQFISTLIFVVNFTQLASFFSFSLFFFVN